MTMRTHINLIESLQNKDLTNKKSMTLSEYIQQQDIPEERKMKLIEMSESEAAGTYGIKKTEMVSKELINAGDVVRWDGEWKTLGKKDVKRDKFMGTSIFGDASPKKVERALFPKFKADGFVRWQPTT